MLQLREDLSPEEWAGKNDNSLIEKINNYENSLNVEISHNIAMIVNAKSY